MGCRFPGGCDDLASYWDLLLQGRDAIERTPPSRWSLEKFYSPGSIKPGKTQSSWGGYVRDIEWFDPKLFGISPREAAVMDPQQRMLLEVAWRSIENAGCRVEDLAGTPVAVYVGISSFDYAVAGLSFQDRGVIGPYSNTGGSSSIAANRISYCFDLRGPSVAVDTACSSSLVAVHHACESLQRGDASMALAGGVNALLLPDFYIAFSQLGVLSPDGRCKTFDARANGYVRSEGAGMVLLKRLSDAQRDGDPIHAVIRATALNQDGRTQGMTVPSREAQESLVRSACERAAVSPCEIQYVEAHGTGTPVGDPIEASALSSVLNENRDRPCLIGSVKTNVGHLEAGAGIASLIKVALSIREAKIPAHLHYQTPHPEIDLEKLNLRVPTETQAWPLTDGMRLAGVNGFGYGGANAHVIVSQAPEIAPTRERRLSPKNASGEITEPILLPISARDEEAIASVAKEWRHWIGQWEDDVTLSDIAGTVAHHRSHLECRAAIVGRTRQEWMEQLDSLSESPGKIAEHRLTATDIDRGILFICSGQGPQWWAMGRNLLKHNRIFRATIERCDREFAKYVEWSLLEELTQEEEHSQLHITEIAQPCIFALQVALADLWKSLGIVPSAIVGHSVGEIAASYLSGALTWQDACCVAIHRGRTMELASSRGAMIAVGLSPTEMSEYLDGIDDQVSIAAINGPTSITVSGNETIIGRLADRLDTQGVFCRRLRVEYAFHSPQMEPVKEALTRALANIAPRANHTPMISTVHPGWIAGAELNADYWWQNVRRSVRFSDAMRVASESGFAVALEIGPHPVLTFAITECFQQSGHAVRVIPSLHRQREDLQCITESLGSLYSIGFDPDWTAVVSSPTRRLALPAYPFQKQELWSESMESRLTRQSQQYHPLLQQRDVGGAQPQWESRLDLRLQPYLSDHTVRCNCVLPAAAIITMVSAASQRITEREYVTLERLQLHHPMLLDDEHPKRVSVKYDESRRQLVLWSAGVDDANWQRMAEVITSSDVSDPATRQPVDLSEAENRCTESVSAEQCYRYCHLLGLQYGPRFRGVVSAQRRDGEALVSIRAPKNDEEYDLHPAVLDSCFHGMIIADREFDTECRDLYLPKQIERVEVLRPLPEKVTAHVRILSKDAYRMIADIDVVDESNRHCLSIRGFESVRVASAGSKEKKTEDLIYRYIWQPSTIQDSNASLAGRTFCVFADQGGLGASLIEVLSRETMAVMIQHGPCFRRINERSFVIDPENRDDFVRVLTEIGRPVTDLVYLWGLDTPETCELSPSTLEKSTVLTTLAPMHLVQAWNQIDESATANLLMVTVDAQSDDGEPEPVALAQAPLVGIGRVIISECSRFRSVLVDLADGDASWMLENLTDEIRAIAAPAESENREDEVCYRNNIRLARRFVPQAGRALIPTPRGVGNFRLRCGESASIDELRYQCESLPELETGQVEIDVAATGLNFSDVMKALDLYPGIPDGPVDLGAECCGTVSRIGASASPSSDAPLKVGDRVIAIAPGGFAKSTVVNPSLIAPWPKELSAADAATIPIAFLTAHYALHECARMRPGETVLIHSASGGVGLAAIQVARQLGGHVLATAGTEEKREYLRALGIEHVMDSRSLAFARQTLQYTEGEGVDAILNSLPGEAIEKGLSLLKTGGRFLEIGKRDIYADRSLGLEPFKNNLALFAIDLDQLFKTQADRMGAMLREVIGKFRSGEYQPLPTKCYSIDKTRDAFRFMQKALHVGKVAVDLSEPPRELFHGNRNPIRFSSEGTYWLAGGLGGFGMEIATWLVKSGVRNLVLSGRRDRPDEAAERRIQGLRDLGAEVSYLRADITSPSEVSQTMRTIDHSMPPLRGVFHTAMVLEDRLLHDLDRRTLARVLEPKVLGGWNLHQATVDRKLDHFVLFSSLSSVFGHAGQANYAAANAFLDSLTHYRRAVGLPAVVINWGHVGEAGYLAERAELGQRLERQGVLSFSVDQATDCLQYALHNQTVQMSVLKMDWSVWRGLGITSETSPRFAHLLVCRGEASEVVSDEIATAAQIRAAQPQQKLEMIRNLVSRKASSLLGIEPENIETYRPLVEMGLDSLMAVELRNWIESRIEIDLPISQLMRSGSIDQLAESIAQDVTKGTKTSVETEKEISGDQAAELLDQLSELPDAEVDALLNQMMKDQ